jgi:hypothetical protein
LNSDLLQHHAAPEAESAGDASDDVGAGPRKPFAFCDGAKRHKRQKERPGEKIAEESEGERADMVHPQLLGDKRSAPYERRGGKKKKPKHVVYLLHREYPFWLCNIVLRDLFLPRIPPYCHPWPAADITPTAIPWLM